MLTILNLFGRSPFSPLMAHMEKVKECVELLPSLFEAVKEGRQDEVEKIADKIGDLEHKADLGKNDIRNHLPKSLFLAVDRSHLLEILSIQDSIADKTEDIAVLCTLKKLPYEISFASDYEHFLKKNIEAFTRAHDIIKELHELLESSFGGVEAEKVNVMVEEVAFLEHEVDLLQTKLLRDLFQCEDKMSYSTFNIWQKIFELTASLSNLSEKLAYRVRMILELNR